MRETCLCFTHQPIAHPAACSEPRRKARAYQQPIAPGATQVSQLLCSGIFHSVEASQAPFPL